PWKAHHRGHSNSTTDFNSAASDGDDSSQKGYSSDSRFFSKVFRGVRKFVKSKTKKASQGLPSRSSSNSQTPIVTLTSPELTGVRKTQESRPPQLSQPLDINCPPFPPGSDANAPGKKEQPLALMASSLRDDIFLADAPKATVISTALPDPRARVESTLQLVFCARLLAEEQLLSNSQSS
ncbi:hypothetical protein BGZ97_009563, partial [Linnemannia gamsii]